MAYGVDIKIDGEWETVQIKEKGANEPTNFTTKSLDEATFLAAYWQIETGNETRVMLIGKTGERSAY